MAFGGNKRRRNKSYIPKAACGKHSIAHARRRRNNIMADFIRDNINKDGIDRRGFLQCMAWAGTGVLYSLHGGILKSLPLMQGAASGMDMAKMKGADFSFIQSIDSHIGFSKETNP